MARSACETRIPCFSPLDPGFVIAKPRQQDECDERKIYELEKRGDLIITRKRNGYKVFAIQHAKTITLYTDGIREIRGLDHIKPDIARLHLFGNTMLVGEVVAATDAMSDYLKVASIVKSNVKRAAELQKTLGRLQYMVFAPAFFGGAATLCHPFTEQLALMKHMFRGKKLRHVVPMTVLEMSFDAAKALTVKEGWEGLVLYTKHYASSYRLDGKDPHRPNGCWKWKPLREADFIVRNLIPDPGNPKRIKEITLSQIHPATKQEIDCGKFGLFSEADRARLRTMKRPFVIQLQFEARFPSGKLQSVRFMCFRDDKRPEDCIAPRNFE